LYSGSEAVVTINEKNKVRITQKTNYPFDSVITVTISPDRKEGFPLFVRIPDWASNADVRVNGERIGNQVKNSEYFRIERTWKQKDQVLITFPMELKVHKKTERIGTPQGGPDMYNVSWFALTRGPLVYASSGLIDGKDREKALSLPADRILAYFSETKTPDGFHGPAYELKTPQGEKLLFLPYYEADGRMPGTWRLTWLQNAIDEQTSAE
jgi:DUF1680 family protein